MHVIKILRNDVKCSQLSVNIIILLMQIFLSKASGEYFSRAGQIDQPLRNQKLAVKPFKEFMVPNDMLCIQKCFVKEKCKTINVRDVKDHVKECQLLDKRMAANGALLITAPKWRHYDLQEPLVSILSH